MNVCYAACRQTSTSFTRRLLVLLVLAALVGAPGSAAARILEVGPHQALRLPSEAARLANDGDTIRLDPANYIDCAVWRASHLTIEATGPGVVIARKSCQGKAIFVITGDDTTIRGLTFAYAVVPDHNGAGIRAEGSGLSIERSRFIGNENGILSGGAPHGAIRIVDSEFRDNGKCDGACAHGIYIGAIDLLRVENSRFSDTHVGHHIKSRARRTELVGNSIVDGPTGTSSYLVDIPNGGDLLMQDNLLQKGPHSSNPTAAISIGAEGVTNATNELLIRHNRFTNLLPQPTIFVRNGTATPAVLSGNRLTGQVVPLEGPGSVTP